MKKLSVLVALTILVGCVNQSGYAAQDDALKAKAKKNLEKQLFEEIRKNDTKGISLSIDQSVDLSARDEYGLTPLLAAVNFGSFDIAELLIKKGAKINEQNDQGQTALMLALKKGNAKLVRLFLANKADVNIKDNNGQTALDIARANDSSAIKLIAPDLEAKTKKEFRK